MSRTDKISVENAAAALGVTAATVKNWLRLGRLRGGGGLVSVEEVERLKASEVLRSRRNKTNITGSRVCGGYIPGHRKLKRLLEEPMEEREIPVVLAEAAIRLMYPGTGRLDAYLGGELKLPCGELVDSLLDGAAPTENTERITSARWELEPEADALGFIYISLLPLSRRRALGAYYTGAGTARLVVSRAEPGGKILDPCCGSGSFLLAAAEAAGSPLELRGMDIDPVAVRLARLNLFLRWPELGTDYLYENITVKDFFEESSSFDSIIGNPPWGGRPERSGAFVLHALELLNRGGRMTFVLPQALLTTRRHAPLRRELLSQTRLRSADYLKTDSFDGVYCPSVALSAEKSPEPGLGGCVVNGSFVLGGRRADDRCLNLNVTDEEYARLEKMRTVPNAVYLKGNALFALGLVTGRNREAVSASEGRPLIRGADLHPFVIDEPTAFLNCKLSDCQQAAPEEVYAAPEKIVYRFIGRKPVFAVDRLGRLTLNSCNIIVPRIEGLDVDYLAAVLNSSAVGFFLEKTFAAEKWLRWHLEEVPIPMAPLERQREIAASPDWDREIAGLYFGANP